MVFFLFHYAGNNRCNPGHCKPCLISIHAPAQGATACPSAAKTAEVFQPTLPHRERRKIGPVVPDVYYISTHAPAQGATAQFWGVPQRRRHFNPRSRTGSDRPHIAIPPVDNAFQSTLPHRERLYGLISAAGEVPFQSTLPHRERPAPPLSPRKTWIISTHAPAQGATDPSPMALLRHTISIHAPAQGATPG